MKLLLTSAGLENDRIADFFIQTVGKDMKNIKALFIITAADNPDAIEVLPKCLEDLFKVGVGRDNITVYDMYKNLSAKELQAYDVIYICGGSTGYLLQRMRESGFDNSLREYIESGGYVLGVSAGSIVLAANTEECLGLVNVSLQVHCTEGDKPGKFALNDRRTVRLTNDQAIWFDGEDTVILDSGEFTFFVTEQAVLE